MSDEVSEEELRLLAEALETTPTPVAEPPVMVEPESLGLADFLASWDLFGDSAMAGAMLGGLLGALGVFIIIRRMVFLSASLSQVASLGIVVAFFLQGVLGWSWLSPTMGATILSACAVALLASERPEVRDRRDGLLGAVFMLGSSGTLLLGSRIVQEVQDVQSILFGTAVAVVPEDFVRVVWTVIVFGLMHVVGHRGFLAITVDSEDARVRGLPVRALSWALLGSIAVVVSVSTGTLGALPTFSFSVLPALSALLVAANLSRATMLAAILGALMGFVGYVLAFLYEWPVGASQTLVGLVMFPLFGLVRVLLRR